MNYKPRKTHEEFIRDLDKIHPNREWKVIGTYEHNKIPILLKDKYGECLIEPSSLLQRSRPSVKTAVNKTEYTVNKFKEVWGSTYDYSEFIYTGARAKSIILCRTHGSFLQDANMHLSGRCGCSKCANEKISERVRSNTKEFIEKAIIKYGDKYSYENSNYLTATENITITCPRHGDFEQTPNRFLNGQICTKCSYKENSSNFHTLKQRRNSSLFYIIECYNETERFIKFGVTTTNVKTRFNTKESMPYNYDILREFRYANKDACFSLETMLLKMTKSVMYEPKLKFSGKTETRQLYIKDKILELFDTISQQLYYTAFLNFCEKYDNIFLMSTLKSGEYSSLEIESVLKGLEIHNKLNNS